MCFFAILAVAGVAQAAFGQQTGNPVIKLIRGSSTTKVFAAGSVGSDDLNLILECGNRAPGAIDGQPWKLTVVSDLTPMQRVLPKAAENMSLAAQSLGFGSPSYTSPMRSISTAAMKQDLKIPAGFQPVAVLRNGTVSKDVDATASASARNKFGEVVN